MGTSEHVGGQPGRGQRANELAGGHQHLAAHVAALLFAGQLVFEVHAGGAGLDHALHQLEGVERSAEAGLGVGHDRQEVVAIVAPFDVLHLVGAAQGVVDPPHDVGHAVGRVQALIRIHLPGVVGVGRHLPAAQVDGLQAGLGHLHRLVAGQRAQRVDVGLERAAAATASRRRGGPACARRAGCRAGGRRPRPCSRGECLPSADGRSIRCSSSAAVRWRFIGRTPFVRNEMMAMGIGNDRKSDPCSMRPHAKCS